jgi:cytochrome c oxidase subunit II
VTHRVFNIFGRSRAEPASCMLLSWRGAPMLLLLALFWLAGCATEATPNALDPRGPAAAEIAGLWWIMFWLAMAVFVAVMALLFLAIYKSRQRQEGDPEPFVVRPSFLLISGVAIPAVILFYLLIISVRTGLAVYGPQPGDPLVIEVVGRMWWWEVRYPQHGVVTANEIYVPAGEPIEFQITSGDVIHSFWVPQLQGKKDMIYGKLHAVPFEIWEPGVYTGICAEFCGIQHTHMLFLLVAQEREEFDAWLAHHQQEAVEPVDPLLVRGQEVYFEAACHHCHMIQGITPVLPATGVVGPDLTHLASRQTLAAAIVENNAANLADFILDPHRLKPGVHMPASPMDGEDLDALVAFLMSLE